MKENEENIREGMDASGKRRKIEFSLLAGAVFLYLYLGLFTVTGYGPIWDVWEYYVGDKALCYYTSFDPDCFDYLADNIRLYDRRSHPDFHEITAAYRMDIDVVGMPWLIWPFGPLTTSLGKWVMYARLGMFGVYDAHHFTVIVWSALLLAALYLFVRRYFSWQAAWTSLLAVAVYPRFWAHAHNNIKDIPSAVLFCLVIFSFYRGLCPRKSAEHGEGVEQSSWRYFMLSAVLWGLSLATKANAFFLPFVLGPWFAYILFLRYRRHKELGIRRSGWGALLSYPVVGLIVMFAAWPLLLKDWPDYFLSYLASLFTRGYGASQGWNLTPVVYAFTTMPLSVMFLLLAGLTAVAVDTVRHRRLDPRYLLLMLWMLVPLLRVCIPGARDFDGIRHWLEFVPAVAVFAGIGYAWLWQKAASLLKGRASKSLLLEYALPALAAVLIFVPVMHWNVRNHPNQVVYFNALIGGLDGAQQAGLPEATDYWCNSYRQGLDWLYENAEEDAVLTVGVAEHLIYFMRELWLREDMLFVPLTDASDDAVRRLIGDPDRPVYLMYVTRKDWYNDIARQYDGRIEPVHTIEVDGGTILKILRLPSSPVSD